MNEIEITDFAAKHILKLISAETENDALRIEVKGGGCSGFQYEYSLTNEMNIEHGNKPIASVPVGHLAQLQIHHTSESREQDTAVISGQNMIIIDLMRLPVR